MSNRTENAHIERFKKELKTAKYWHGIVGKKAQ